MPSKYSHGVVLSTYSSRGIISQPDDKHLDYLNSSTIQPEFATRGRAPSAPPSHDHRSTRPESSRSTKWRKRASTVSESGAVYRQHRNGAVNNFQTLGEPHNVTPRSRARTIIVDSDEDNAEDDTHRQDSLPSEPNFPAASPPIEARLSFPFVLGPEMSSSMRRPQSSTGVCNWSASAGIGFTSLGRNHVASLAAQKYELKDDLGYQTRSPRRHSLIAHDSTSSRSDDFAEPLLSIHEFLGFPAQLKPRGHDTMAEPGALLAEHGSASVLGSALSSPHAARVLPELRKSQTRPSLRRDHMSFTDISDEEDRGNCRDEAHLEPFAETKSVPSLTSQTSALGHTILDRKEEEPPETNDMPLAVPGRAIQDKDAKMSTESTRRDDDSDDPIEGPTLPLEALHRSLGSELPARCNDTTAPRNDVALTLSCDGLSAHEANSPIEPDFSHFSDDEEPEDVMNGILTDIYIHERCHGATDKVILGNDERPNLSPSMPPRSARKDIGRPSTPVGLRTASVGSNGHNGRNSVECDECGAVGLIPLSPTASTISTQQTPSAKHVPKLKSEEEMRMRIPTPIPSPTASKARHISPYRPATQTRIAISNIGVPSIVRSPQHKKQKQADNVSSPKLQKMSRSRQKQDPVKASRKRLGNSRPTSVSNSIIPSGGNIVFGTRIDGEDEGSEIWAVPTAPVSQKIITPKGAIPTPFYPDFTPRLGPRSGSLTSRPRTAEWRPQSATLCRNLVTAFDDISSERSMEWEPDLTVSNAGLGDLVGPAGEGDDERDEEEVEEGDEDQSEPDSDPDAALPPPDISRHPPDRGSPRSARNDPHRLSSLTSLPWKTMAKAKARRKSKADMEPVSHSEWASISMPDHPTDTALRSLDQWTGSRLETGRQRAHAAGPSAGVDTGPGRTTGVARLEAIMEQAEEEARANRKKGIRGLWQRLKRRIES